MMDEEEEDRCRDKTWSCLFIPFPTNSERPSTPELIFRRKVVADRDSCQLALFILIDPSASKKPDNHASLNVNFSGEIKFTLYLIQTLFNCTNL